MCTSGGFLLIDGQNSICLRISFTIYGAWAATRASEVSIEAAQTVSFLFGRLV